MREHRARAGPMRAGLEPARLGGPTGMVGRKKKGADAAGAERSRESQ
jgi:hypothetical protein